LMRYGSTHKTMVHGDVNARNMVWDPTGYFFQFVDLRLATWRMGDTASWSDALAIDPLQKGSPHAARAVARPCGAWHLEYCSCTH
jgi:Ser/Thr protein kinase RdoA (MazF antagonist)